MKVFGYGSLINRESILKTVSDIAVVGADTLCGYKRVFNLQSHQRKNPVTNIHSAVLNLEPASDVCITGLLFEITPHEREQLLAREQGYKTVALKLNSGVEATVFFAQPKRPYGYVYGDKWQEEYLDICLAGAKALGDDAYENFLDTTFIAEQSIRTYLETR
jgi:cation transport regulator ChaC